MVGERYRRREGHGIRSSEKERDRERDRERERECGLRVKDDMQKTVKKGEQERCG